METFSDINIREKSFMAFINLRVACVKCVFMCRTGECYVALVLPVLVLCAWGV